MYMLSTSSLSSSLFISSSFFFFFFFNDTATTEIYTLSLHDALPISASPWATSLPAPGGGSPTRRWLSSRGVRSEEHTSELQSHSDLVCRLLLEKKKKKKQRKNKIKKQEQQQLCTY